MADVLPGRDRGRGSECAVTAFARMASCLRVTRTGRTSGCSLLPGLSPGCRGVGVRPEPMTRNSLAELRHGMGRTTTIWGGIPSVALLDDSMGEPSVLRPTSTRVFDELGTGERLILGVSDNVPPNANLDRLARISERVAAFGAINPAG